MLVLDLTRVLAGPYCTMVLADLGARVIKIEPPGVGDDSRHIGPFLKGKSAYFMSINRGKESIALDLKGPADRAIFERLLGVADVLVENYRGGTMEKLGYGWDDLHPRFPRLIYAAASVSAPRSGTSRRGCSPRSASTPRWSNGHAPVSAARSTWRCWTARSLSSRTPSPATCPPDRCPDLSVPGIPRSRRSRPSGLPMAG